MTLRYMDAYGISFLSPDILLDTINLGVNIPIVKVMNGGITETRKIMKKGALNGRIPRNQRRKKMKEKSEVKKVRKPTILR